jgi:hypothetical protein
LALVDILLIRAFPATPEQKEQPDTTGSFSVEYVNFDHHQFYFNVYEFRCEHRPLSMALYRVNRMTVISQKEKTATH